MTLLGSVIEHVRCDLLTDIRAESVACKQGISLLPPPPRIRFPAQARGASRDEMPRGCEVGISGHLPICLGAAGGCDRTTGQHLADGVVGDALLLQLTAQGHDSAGSDSVTALHPRLREGEVVKIAQGHEPLDDLVAQRGWVAEMVQAAARLLDRPGAYGEEGGRGLHDDIRVGDRGSPSPPCFGGISAFLCGAGWVGQLFRLGDALHGNVDLGDLGADLRLELLRDVLVGAEELLGLLTPLAQARLAVVEPGA